ncbi:hypothetical protein QVD17_31329 [Tagetes erecta]|uniref:Uncharacterized protein n=1 Tax=Tagetes erecta TaxID=13708 RepID=A0AAD8NP36_TARER|nr:hypothetical protein QVD17_31329 [Tagetes erecta]
MDYMIMFMLPNFVWCYDYALLVLLFFLGFHLNCYVLTASVPSCSHFLHFYWGCQFPTLHETRPKHDTKVISDIHSEKPNEEIALFILKLQF